MTKQKSYISRYYQGENWKSVKEEFQTPSSYASRLFTDIRYQENDKGVRGVDLEKWVKENKEKYPKLYDDLESLGEKRENLYRTRLTGNPVNDEHFQDQLYYVMKCAKSHVLFNQEVEKTIAREQELAPKDLTQKEVKNENHIDVSSMLAQVSRPSEAQINSSVKADFDDDARFGDITTIGEIPSELIVKLDDLKGIENKDIKQLAKASIAIDMFNAVIDTIDNKKRDDVKRNFTETLQKALDNNKINLPPAFKEVLEKRERQILEKRNQAQKAKSLNKDYEEPVRNYPTINVVR